MTCYQRQMRWLFEELDVEYTQANRRRVDASLRTILAVPEGAHCPEVWSAVKELSPDELVALTTRVSDTLRGG